MTERGQTNKLCQGVQWVRYTVSRSQATRVITHELARNVHDLAREYCVRAENATFEDKRALLDAIQLEITVQQRAGALWAATRSRSWPGRPRL